MNPTWPPVSLSVENMLELPSLLSIDDVLVLANNDEAAISCANELLTKFGRRVEPKPYAIASNRRWPSASSPVPTRAARSSTPVSPDRHCEPRTPAGQDAASQDSKYSYCFAYHLQMNMDAIVEFTILLQVSWSTMEDKRQTRPAFSDITNIIGRGTFGSIVPHQFIEFFSQNCDTHYISQQQIHHLQMNRMMKRG
jgi:hypothetical protein